MIRAHDYQPPLPLKATFELSVYLEAIKNSIEQARIERLPNKRDAQLREAHRLMEQPQFALLPGDEQQNLFRLFGEAYLRNVRAG